MGWILDILQNFGLEVGKHFRGAAQTLFADRTKAFSVGAVCSLLGVILGIWSLSRADYYQRVVERALAKKTENTPQTFKALEGLILADVDTWTPVNYQRKLSESAVSTEFARVIGDIHAKLSGPTSAGARILEIAEPDLMIPGSQRPLDAIVTEKSDLGFLFLPYRLLRLPAADFAKVRPLRDHNKEPNREPETRKELERKLGIVEQPQNTETCGPSSNAFCDDVLLTRSLLPILKKATSYAVTASEMPGINLKPQQAYVITGNGLNRIVSQDQNDSEFYRNQFRASTVFPARPYYAEAFARAEPQELLVGTASQLTGTLGYFYISQPYLDIGGNGIVVTLSRAYRYPNHSDGAICFDLKLNPDGGLTDKLRDFIESLEGTTAEVSCTMSRDAAPSCQAGSGNGRLGKEGAAELEKNLKEARKNISISDVLGNFSFIRRDFGQIETTSKAGVVDSVIQRLKHPDHELRFTLSADPPRVTSSEKQEVKISFLVASLNVGRYLQKTAILSALALSCLAFAFTIVVGAWASETRLTEDERKQRKLEAAVTKDLHDALQNVAKVMLRANTPYVRLDNSDHIVDANLKLAEFLDLPPDQSSIDTQLLHTRFEDWLANDQSKREYHRVQNLRRQGKPVDPYVVSFRTVENRVVSATIVSSVVPQTSEPGALPETFGIIV